jgi:acetyl-CoA acetyltransferase
MGWTSEMVAQHYQVPRKKQDEYAYVSHRRAAKVVSIIPIVNYPKSKTSFQAQSSGVFAEEIIPINLKGVIISEDDTIRPGVTMDGLSALKPVFPNWGHASTTAGNASGVGDGAGICILTTRAKAQEEGMEIVGKYVASTVVGKESHLILNSLDLDVLIQEWSHAIWVFHQYTLFQKSCFYLD